jgi:cytochrome d ubiquinol oxidase subunit I
VFIQYWSMRAMAYLALVGLLVGVWGAVLLWRRKFETSRFFLRVCTWLILVPFVMATAGWLLTESGRQPWIVQGLMLTTDGLSGSGSATQVGISLGIVLVLYTTLGIIAATLMVRHTRRGIPDEPAAPDEAAPADGSTAGGAADRAGRDTSQLTY